MQSLLIAYLGVVVVLLTISTSIDSDEGVDLKHILIAAFAWPLAAPIIALKAWRAR